MSAISVTASVTGRGSIFAAIIGNALEWFDVVAYGFFAAVIADLFFPGKDRSVALIYTLGTLGLSFVVRPVGAIIVGRFADRAGRRAALVLVSTLMMLGTLLIAVLPTYAQIGVAAPVLLLVARLVQGFSAGGEFGSATAYLAEQSPDRRGYYSSWQFASQGISTLLASGLGLVLTLRLDPRQLYAWGWRLPFVFGLLIGPVAYFIRTHASETPEFEAARVERAATGRNNRVAPSAIKVIVGTGAVTVATVSLYLMLYTPTFARTVLGLDPSVGFAATFAVGVTLLLVPPFSGTLSDRIGRLKVALPAVVLLGVLPIPLFGWLVHEPSAVKVVLVEISIGAVTAVYLGALPAFLAELFPVESRTTGLSLCYNFAVVIAGGFAPLISAMLVKVTGNRAAPSFYLVFAAGISLLSLIVARRRRWTW